MIVLGVRLLTCGCLWIRVQHVRDLNAKDVHIVSTQLNRNMDIVQDATVRSLILIGKRWRPYSHQAKSNGGYPGNTK
jgi:hypothetical protein